MKALKEKREKLADLRKELTDLLAADSLSAEQITRTAEITDEVNKLNAEIDTLETAQRAAAAAAPAAPVVHGTSGESKDEKNVRENFSFRNLMKAALEKRNLTGLEAEMHQEAVNELRHAGVATSGSEYLIPKMVFHRGMTQKGAEKRTQSATGGSNGSEGGVNVATNVGGIIDALSPYLVLAQMGIQRFDGLVGNLVLPRNTSTPEAAWETETGSANDLTATWGKVTLSPKRLAGYIPVTSQLMIQSSNDIENYIRQYLLSCMAVSLEKAAIKGGGSNEPTGIIGNSDVLVTYAGNAAAVGTNANGANQVYADWVNLMKKVMENNGTLLAPSYLTNPTVLGDAMIRPKQSSGVEGNFIVTNPALAPTGYGLNVTSCVPNNLTKGTSSDLSALIFGDFSKLAIASWGGMSILVDPYSSSLSGTTNIVLNSFVDVGVLQPKSFAVCKDIDATTPA